MSNFRQLNPYYIKPGNFSGSFNFLNSKIVISGDSNPLVISGLAVNSVDTFVLTIADNGVVSKSLTAGGGAGTSGSSGSSGSAGSSGTSGSSGANGTSGSSGESGTSGTSGTGLPADPDANAVLIWNDAVNEAQWDTGKTAIVPHKDEFVALYCVESPEVRFEEIIFIDVKNRDCIIEEIDPIYYDVCEKNSIKPISYACSEPVACGIQVKDNLIIIKFNKNDATPEEITLKLSGIRKGFKKRFSRKTKEEMIKNNKFWAQSG